MTSLLQGWNGEDSVTIPVNLSKPQGIPHTWLIGTHWEGTLHRSRASGMKIILNPSSLTSFNMIWAPGQIFTLAGANLTKSFLYNSGSVLWFLSHNISGKYQCSWNDVECWEICYHKLLGKSISNESPCSFKWWCNNYWKI